jgi:acetolactate synthase-1/2/3 large subunit
MRVADYIAQSLARLGITHVFLVTGGGAMHLNDAFGRENRLSVVCCHHEQSCAIAAEGYARLLGRPAILNVTSGPGGINAINGVFGAYTDSIPMVVVSGQARRETIMSNFPIGLRQLGDQEVDIVRMVGGVTKYAVMVQDPQRIRYEIEKAFWLAVNGRPGPVWIDVPIDVQGSQIDENELEGFDPVRDAAEVAALLPTEAKPLEDEPLRVAARQVLHALAQSKRPCIMPGTGVRIAGAAEIFLDVVNQLGVPVATAFNAHDLLANDNPLYVGKPGTVGDRAGNFAVQNSDFLLVLGCRLNIRQISYNWDSFARAAKVSMVDIDKAELGKPTLKIALPVHAELKTFLAVLKEEAKSYRPSQDQKDYLAWCRARVTKYPTVLPEYWATKGAVNPYCFAGTVWKHLDKDDVIVTGDATACVVTFQTAKIKQGQRLFSNSGCASMGYDLPAAIGAWHANTKAKRVICFAGDGSIMMNLQELQTIIGQKIPMKIFIPNNSGYHSIRQTQQNYFPDNVVGCGPESGVSFPDFLKLGEVLGFGVRRTSRHDDMEKAIIETLESPGPQICEVMIDKNQQFAPKLASRRLEDGRMVTSALEDLAPFLSREELATNMLIPLIES